jgi:hypothetical protein
MLASETINMVRNTRYTNFNYPLFPAIEPVYNAFFVVIDKPIFSGTGDRIAALDKRRDKVFTGLHEIVKRWCYIADEDNSRQSNCERERNINECRSTRAKYQIIL